MMANDDVNPHPHPLTPATPPPNKPPKFTGIELARLDTELGPRVTDALLAENTGDYDTTYDVIVRRCLEAGYPAPAGWHPAAA
jgi:hypothetical protein